VTADTGNAGRRATETNPAEPSKIKTEKTGKAKKEVDREKKRSKHKDRRIKSEKSTRRSRNLSSTEEMSEDDKPKLKKKVVVGIQQRGVRRIYQRARATRITGNARRERKKKHRRKNIS